MDQNQNPMAVLAALLAPMLQQMQQQGQIDQYVNAQSSPATLEAQAAKSKEYSTRGRARARDMYGVIDDLGPYMAYTIAFSMYYKARSKHFESRMKYEESRVNLDRMQDQGATTGEAEFGTTAVEEPLNQVGKAEWWCQTHSENMDKYLELAWTAHHLVEVANDVLRNDPNNQRDPTTYIEVDVSEKAYITHVEEHETDFARKQRERNQARRQAAALEATTTVFLNRADVA